MEAKSEYVVDPEFSGDENLMWLVGILESRGVFEGSPAPEISLSVIDLDVVIQAAKIMRGEISKGRGSFFTASVRGNQAIALMKKLHPLMGKRLQKEIEESL
jgi:hypothetical protein